MPTQQERNAETRHRLLVAAREVLRDDGYESASVAEIAKRAGRAHGSFYLHFADKQAVVFTLLDDALSESNQLRRTCWQGSSMRVAVRDYIDRFEENSDLWSVLDQLSSLEPAFAAMRDRCFQELTYSIEVGMPECTVPGLDRRLLAHVLAAMLYDSTRAAFQQTRAWTVDDLTDELTRVLTLTSGAVSTPPG